jgi:hypothetical protein
VSALIARKLGGFRAFWATRFQASTCTSVSPDANMECLQNTTLKAQLHSI